MAPPHIGQIQIITLPGLILNRQRLITLQQGRNFQARLQPTGNQPGQLGNVHFKLPFSRKHHPAGGRRQDRLRRPRIRLQHRQAAHHFIRNFTLTLNRLKNTHR